MIDTEGFITLTGRKSEIFKTSTGRRIASTGIESVLRQTPYVEHAAVFGADRPFLVAVLAVAEEAWRVRARVIAGNSGLAALCDVLRQDLAPALATLADYQRPAGVVVTTSGFSIEAGELTPNLKLRRTQVESSFREWIEKLYGLLETRHGALPQTEYDGGQVVLCCLGTAS